MKKISILQPIINAVDETDPSVSRYQNQMLKWAKYIEKKIGSKLAYPYKSKLFNVNGCTIELPDDCYRVVGVLPGDYTDECNARYMSLEWLSVQKDERTDEDLTLLWRPAESSWVEPRLWEEIGEELHLLIKYENQDMTLLYQYIQTDDKGYWLINESHSEAITRFIKYKFAQKYNWNIFRSDKLLRQGHVQFLRDLEREYSISVRNARAEDGEASPFETEQY